MEPSEAVEARVRAEAAKLDRYFNRITSCRVMIEAAHRHHKWGDQFHVRIDLGVPGEEIVIQHAPTLRQAMAGAEAEKVSKKSETGAAHKDMYVTIRDAFNAARRKLEEYARRLRGEVKLHDRVPPHRAEKLNPGGTRFPGA